MTKQRSVCPTCGKAGREMDFFDEGKTCRKPEVLSPCAGDWICLDKAKRGKTPHIAQLANESSV